MNLYKGLSIGELSKRTGLGISTLRAWERRYGFPVPQRLPGGHRRYSDHDVAALQEIIRERAGGVTLDAAIRRVRESAAVPAQSVFAALRHALPHVESATLSKRAMLALSHAIEDEAAVHADVPVFVGAFQERRFWSVSRAQWRTIATRSELTVAIATGVPRRNARQLWQVPIDATQPLAQEWAVVCDAPSFSACVVGRERASGDAGRRFDALWSVEPGAVRAALRAALAVAVASTPALGEAVPARVGGWPSADYDSLRFATSLTARVVRYLDR